MTRTEVIEGSNEPCPDGAEVAASLVGRQFRAKVRVLREGAAEKRARNTVELMHELPGLSEESRSE